MDIFDVALMLFILILIEKKYMFHQFIYQEPSSGQNIFRVTYAAFSFSRPVGVLPAFATMRVPMKFSPRETGSYSQHWEVKSCADCAALATDSLPHVIRMELIANVKSTSRKGEGW